MNDEKVDDISLEPEYVLPAEDTWDGVIYKIVYEYNKAPYRPGDAKGTGRIMFIQLEEGAGTVELDGVKSRLSVRAFDGKKTPFRDVAAMHKVDKASELIGKMIRVLVKHRPRKNGKGNYALAESFLTPKTKGLELTNMDPADVGCFKRDYDKQDDKDVDSNLPF